MLNNIIMVKEIDIKNIKKISYGIMNRYVDVTNILLEKLNSGNSLTLSNNIFQEDPYIGKLKKIIFYYNTGIHITLNENDIIKKKSSIVIPVNMPVVEANKNINFNYIVSTNARDEPNIVEWIIYHLMIGFTFILIIDHKSKIPINMIIQNYDWKYKVHVIRREDEGAVKMIFLNDIIVPFMTKKCKKYFIHLDADEYFYLDNNTTLDKLTSQVNSDIIAVNWVMFGCNNVERNTHKFKCLIPTYTRSSKNIDMHFKCMIRIDINHPFYFTDPHTIKYKTIKNAVYKDVLGNIINGNNVMELMHNIKIKSIDDMPVYINHYFVQSKEDYMRRKVNRVRDDIAVARPLDLTVFNIANDVENNNILTFSDIIVKQIEMNDSKVNNNMFGFIMIRYVKCAETNKSWIRCYESIRKHYSNMIVIIDDNSDMQFVSNDYQLFNCKIIKSEFPRRGELLPYYYYIKHNFFKRAIVVHDSMEIAKYYDYKNIPNYKNFTRLFSFTGPSYNMDIEYFKHMCDHIINGNEVYNFHNTNKSSLFGCFGICYVIDYDYLININKKYNIINLLNFVDTRKKRQTLERFLSCLFEYDKGRSFITRKDLFGCIHSNKGEFIRKHYFGR